jgi:hypothetical protein
MNHHHKRNSYFEKDLIIATTVIQLVLLANTNSFFNTSPRWPQLLIDSFIFSAHPRQGGVRRVNGCFSLFIFLNMYI